MILFEAIYCIIMFLLYLVGTVCFASQCTTKYLFPRFWTSSDELLLILSGLATFVLHYVLLGIGCKKGFLDRFVVRALTILDIVLYGSQLILLICFYVSNMARFLPIFVINGIIITLRLLTGKKVSVKL